MMKPVTLILSIAAVLVVFCGCNSTEKGTIYVYCDEVLRTAVTEIASEFEGESGYEVKLIFDPEDRVFRRLKLSKQADLYLAITPTLIEKAKDFDLSKGGEEVASIVPAIITTPLNPLEIKSMNDLGKAELRFGINELDTTLGATTKRLFDKNGFDWEEVRQAIHYPSEEEALLFGSIQDNLTDVAITWNVTALEGERIDRVPIPPKENVCLPVVAMVLEKSEHPEVAADLIRFMKSPEMKSTWEEFGFEGGTSLRD